MRKPKPSDRFEHARFITGSPKAGTARPVVCVVTAVRGSTVYYRADDAGSKWRIDADKFDSIVGRWLDATDPKEK